MGIHNLGKFITDKWGDAVKCIPMSTFNGRRIAVDGNNWLHKIWCASYSQVVNETDVALEDPDPSKIIKIWLKKIQEFIRKLLSNGITPVFVLDGKAPPEKFETQQERRAVTQKNRDKILQLRNTFRQMDVLSITPTMIEEMRKCLRQDTYPSSEDINLFKMVMRGIGMPVLQAKGEAEQLCSYLSIENKVAAVFSTDTDNLVYGCPILLRGINKAKRNPQTGLYEESFEGIILSKVLSLSKLSKSSFIDLCIMAKCDYNNNIKNLAIGRAYPLMIKYGSIDNLPPTYDLSPLKHVRCRELFSYRESYTVWINEDDDEEHSTNNDINNYLNIKNTLIENGRDILEPYGLESWLQELSKQYRNLPTPVEQPVLRETVTLKFKPANSSGSDMITKPKEPIDVNSESSSAKISPTSRSKPITPILIDLPSLPSLNNSIKPKQQIQSLLQKQLQMLSSNSSL